MSRLREEKPAIPDRMIREWRERLQAVSTLFSDASLAISDQRRGALLKEAGDRAAAIGVEIDTALKDAQQARDHHAYVGY